MTPQLAVFLAKMWSEKFFQLDRALIGMAKNFRPERRVALEAERDDAFRTMVEVMEFAVTTGGQSVH